MAHTQKKVDTSAKDGGLKQILEDERVPQVFQDMLGAMGADYIQDFVNLVIHAENEGEELKVLADSIEELKDNGVMLSRIRSAWQLASQTWWSMLPDPNAGPATTPQVDEDQTPQKTWTRYGVDAVLVPPRRHTGAHKGLGRPAQPFSSL